VSRLVANIEIIFISCKVCNFITPNYARLTTMSFEKDEIHLVWKPNKCGFILWENSAMKIFAA